MSVKPPNRNARCLLGLAQGAFLGGFVAGLGDGGLVSTLLWTSLGLMFALLVYGYAPGRVLASRPQALLGLGVCLALPSALLGQAAVLLLLG